MSCECVLCRCVCVVCVGCVYIGVLSGSMVVSWRGSLVMGEGVSVVELGRVELCQQQLSDPTLQCHQERGVALWEGGERVTGDLCDRDTQDLACLLATQHIAEVNTHIVCVYSCTLNTHHS